MHCSSCKHENAAGASFCEECGARLERRCPSCDAACGPAAKFCSACGTSLAARPAPPRVEAVGGRKVVTILFSDLIGSVGLQERLDPESASRVMERYHRLVRAEVEREGGSLVQLIGDGVMCAFGVPQLAEDDALRAVRAAVAVQRAFREFAAEESTRVGRLGLRIAVNTGEVVPSVDLPAGIGDPLNVAARLQQEAKDGDVVIGEATERVVRDKVTLERLGVFALKGRSETVAAYRVVSLERPAGAAATPFVGREDELERLTAVYESTLAERRARLAVVLGSPGLGKSRLIDELGRRVGEDTTVLAAHCDLTRGATFAPIAKALRSHLGIDDAAGMDAARAAVAAAAKGDDAERARIADGVAAILAGKPASPEETFFVVRRFLASLAADRPLVLAIDDLQWAEPLLLDLLEHLIQWVTEVPVLVLVAARPELRESRSSLATTGGFVSEVVTLAGLDAAAATRLAANVIGAEQLPAAVAGRVLATSEGNPLFVGELVRMLVSEGALKREGERWTASAELAKLEMPPTIQALLAARIERLKPEERMVLERAAVVGRQFSRAAVTHLLPREITDLDVRLEALRRSELIEPDSGWLLGEPVLRFHHVLIRDAAYRRLLKNTRAELHERFADWLSGRVGDAVEHDETIGWHLEQAHRNLQELGPLDEHGRALGERAARHLAAAGRRALAREDLPLAGNLLGRALDRLDAADPARADLALDWCEALLAAADVAAAAPAVEELGRFTADSARLKAWHTCFSSQLVVFTDPKNLRATASAVAAAAEELAAAGDAAGEAKGHYVNAMALTRLGKIGACEAALDRALAAARRAGDRRRSNAVLAGAPVAALWGPSPVTRASGRCLDVVRVLRITEGAPGVEAVALRCQGVLEALRGRTDAARRMIATARRMVEELGITHQLLEADAFAGLIEFLEGDAAAAERSLRAAYDGLREQGLGIDAARAAALLGRALLALDRAAEAETLSHESEALAGDDLKAASAWRAVRAEALARRGEHTAAVELARAAVDIAAATDALLDHADARLALAAALRAAGKGAEASAEEARAIELWEAKGATLLAERARRIPASPPLARDRAEPVRAISKPKRRVRPNAAVAHTAAFDAAIAARDLGTALENLTPDYEFVDHVHRITSGRKETGRVFQALMNMRGGKVAHEPLASLGESLALFRFRLSASGVAGREFDVGPYEYDSVFLVEADLRGKARRAEVFSPDHLGDAVARLYERYAEVLPEGCDRERARAISRSARAWLGPLDFEQIRASTASAVELIDHRAIGLPSQSGAAAFLDALRTLFAAATNLMPRVDDVLALRPDVSLLRYTNTGTDRTSGGSFERKFLQLMLFDREGYFTRMELFDVGDEEQGFARFDELTAARTEPTPKPKRRVRTNAAIEMTAALDAVVAAGDLRPLEDLVAAHLEYVDHVNHVTYGREEAGRNFELMIGAQSLVVTHEPIASLGDSLAVFNRRVTARGGPTGRRFDVGPWEHATFLVIETDSRGKCRRVDVFAVDHLGDAVARLYERYGELVAEGIGRERAAATARSLAAWLGRHDFDRMVAALAPAVKLLDRRTIGLPARSGAPEVRESIRSLFELAIDPQLRTDAILDAVDGACLLSSTGTGTLRAGGGKFEQKFILLFRFGGAGLIEQLEIFDVGDDRRALERFDEIAADRSEAVPKPKRRLQPNATTAGVALLDAAMAARDADALRALTSDDCTVIDHPTGTTYDGAGNLASRLMLLRADDLRFAHEALATLGDTLGLFRLSITASGAFGRKMDIGPYEREVIVLAETEDRRERRGELFATDRLSDAVARMYARYAELLPEGAERDRAARMARSVATVLGPIDLDRFASVFAASVESDDRRHMGGGLIPTSARVLESLQTLLDNTHGAYNRADDILALRPGGFLLRLTNCGTLCSSGGSYERPFLFLMIFGAHGLVDRIEQFDIGWETEALARFDELTAKPSCAVAKLPRRVRPNAATRHADRIQSAITTRDADALRDAQGENAELISHPNGAVYGRQGLIDTVSMLWRSDDLSYGYEPLATLGESLALCRVRISVSGRSELGPGDSEFDLFDVVEADEHGRSRRVELFAADRLGEAIVRLYERYAEMLPDGPARDRALATARSVAIAMGPFDPDLFATAHAKNIEGVDHRAAISWGTVRGVEEFRKAVRSLLDLATDVTPGVHDVVALQPEGFLIAYSHLGIERIGGGPFERHFLVLWIFGDDGLATNVELFDVERRTEALARFDELTAKPSRRVRPNLATASVARVDAAIAARDANGLEELFADEMQVVNHHLAGGIYDREGALQTWRTLLAAQDPACRHEPLATLGDSLALFRQSLSASGFTGARFDVGAYERETIAFHEVDAEGRQRRAEFFAAAQLGDAIVRLYERYAEILPEGAERTRATAIARSMVDTLGPAFPAERLAATSAPTVEAIDHRNLALWSARGREELLKHFRSWYDVATDVVIGVDDIVALTADALLVPTTNSGRDRVGGGTYERRFLILFVFGADGRRTHIEWFDCDRQAEALARFDELTAPPPATPKRRVRPNAATANGDRVAAAMAAGRTESLPELFSDDAELLDHRHGMRLDRGEALLRATWAMEGRRLSVRHEPIATLGNSLALSRWLDSAIGDSKLDVGPYEIDLVVLTEVDERGRNRAAETFAPDRLGDAVVRLYERYAESLPEGSERERAATMARAIATMVESYDPDRYATALAPDLVAVDQRTTIGWGVAHGYAEWERIQRALLAIAKDITQRVDDILDLRPEALLLRWTNYGIERIGGGPYERQFLIIFVRGADGRLARFEFFDPDRDDEALARFDEIVVGRAVASAPKRRVRRNRATEHSDRVEAAMAAGRVGELPELFSDDVELVDHIHGAVLHHDEVVLRTRYGMEGRSLIVRSEPRATLGDSLALSRWSSSAIAATDTSLDVGPYEHDFMILHEVDERGRGRRSELFAIGRLGEAVIRLYQRYAELHRVGPERERAKTTARSIALLLASMDLDRWAEAFAPNVEFVDLRTTGFGTLSGSDAVVRGIRALFDLIEDPAMRMDDVLAAAPDALLVLRTNHGTLRATGGAFERPLCHFFVFGADGLLARWEQSDADRAADALLRFEELTPRRDRRVRPNAATAWAERLSAAVAARDLDALPALITEDADYVRHQVRTIFDREAVVRDQRALIRARDPVFAFEPLASLGDRLAVGRYRTSASGFVGRNLDVGPYAVDETIVVEVDAAGRMRHVEAFANERLGDAVALLYERYAVLLREGPERRPAAATARSLAVILAGYDPDRWATVLAPTLERVDHRTLGFESGRGRERFLHSIRALLELAGDIAMSIEDVIRLSPDALLIAWAESGRDRSSGGRYERRMVVLWIFDADGFLARIETFDADREADALARFDELAAEPPRVRRVASNAATVRAAELDAAVAVRNADALPALFADESEAIDHTTGTTWARQGAVSSFRALMKARDSKCSHEPLATLGSSLGIFRVSSSAAGFSGGNFDVGPYEREQVLLSEVDEQGRNVKSEAFAADRLGDAVVRLYERYAKLRPEGAERERAAATACSLANAIGPIDVDRIAAVFDPSVVGVDHRTLGTWASRGRDEFLGHLRAYLEVAESPVIRIDDIIALRPDALLTRGATFGTDRVGGGRFERPYLLLCCFGADGLVTRYEQFDVECEDAALARFDELTAERPSPRIENAATRANDRFDEAWRAGDWEAVESLFAPDLRVMDHRPYAHFELDRGQEIESLRTRFRMSSSHVTSEILATRGDRLVLGRAMYEVADQDVGPSVTGTSVFVSEVDQEGRVRSVAVFAPEDLDAAYEELDARFRAGEAATHPRSGRTFQEARAARDWETASAQLAPDFVLIDHRFPGLGTIHGPAEYVDTIKALVGLAPDHQTRIDHVVLSRGTALVVLSSDGTWHGGVFETRGIVVSEFDGRDRIRRFDFYDYNQLEEAKARFAEIRFDPLRIPANAASVAKDRHLRALQAGDSAAADALCAPTLVFEDRRRLVRTSGGRELFIASNKLIAESGARAESTDLAIAGERLVLMRLRWHAALPIEFEMECLAVNEVDADGRLTAVVLFDLDDRRAASMELLERFARGEGAHWPTADGERTINGRDLDRLRALMPADFVFDDHRRTGAGRIEGPDKYLSFLGALFEQSPDVIIERLYAVAVSEHAIVDVAHNLGTRTDGGAFESVFARLLVFRDGLLARAELFEPDDLDAARARFEALRADEPV